MKNYILFTLIFGLLFFASSCKKDGNMDISKNAVFENNTKDSKARTLYLSEWSARARSKGMSISRSTPVDYSYSDAAVNIEALLNFTYRRPDTIYQSYQTFYDTLKVVANQSYRIDELDLDTLFISIVNRSSYVFDQNTSIIKAPVQFGIRALDTNGSIVDSVRIELFFLYGLNYDTPVPLEDPLYEEDDHWWYGGGAGKCGPYSGGQPLDAAKIFTRDLRRALIPRAAPNYEFYFSAPVIACFHVGNYCSAYDIPPLNYNYYYQQGEDFQNPWLYWGTMPDVCLDPELMNWHYPIYRDRFIKDYQPYSKVPSSLWVGYDIINTSRVHALAVVYSTKNYFEAVSSFPVLLEPIP
jgi:hypothetical protein